MLVLERNKSQSFTIGDIIEIEIIGINEKSEVEFGIKPTEEIQLKTGKERQLQTTGIPRLYKN